MPRLISATAIKQKTFVTLDFEGEWLKKYGEVEQNFRALLYGPSGSGKSVEVLRLGNYLANNFGKVLYNSHEEGISQTLQRRIQEWDIDSPRLMFADRMSFDDMCEKVAKGRYKFAIIDSGKYMGFTWAMYKEFVRRFPKKSLIIIDQVNGKGKIKGGTDLLHAVDIKAYFNAGKLEVRSRFIPKGGYYTTQLFKPNTNDLTLF